MIALLIDLDGVLWFSERVHKDAFIEALSVYTKEAQNLINSTWIFGESTEEYSKRILNHMGIEHDLTIVNNLITAKRLIASKESEIPVNWSLINALDAVKREDVSIALVSSSSKENVKKFLKVTQSKSTFDCVVDASLIKKPKPHPDCYNYAMNKLGISPIKCIAIEDSQLGIAAAKKASISTVISFPEDFKFMDEKKFLLQLIARLEN